MKKNRILVLSSLVSLIPLASISVVSCKKEKTETNSGDNNNNTGGGNNNNTGGGNNNNTGGGNNNNTGGDNNTGGGNNNNTGGDNNTGGGNNTGTPDSTPSVPDKVEPNPGETPDSGTDGGNGSTSNSGIMKINDYELGFTADESGKWWFNVRVYGSYLSNNIEHYSFSTKDEKIQIPNDYFNLQMVSSERTWAYFTQRIASGHEELYKWLKEQYDKRNYHSVVVSPTSDNIRIEVPSKPSEIKTPQITTFSLSKTNYGNYVERSITVNGQYLSSKWDQYELTWKDGDNITVIPSHLFRNSQFNDGVNYQVFRLSQTADQKFVEEFDRLLTLSNQGTQVFELKIKEKTN